MQLVQISESFLDIFNREWKRAEVLTFTTPPSNFRDALKVNLYTIILNDVEIIRSKIVKTGYQETTKQITVKVSGKFMTLFNDAWKRAEDFCKFKDDNFREALKFTFEEVMKKDGFVLEIEDTWIGNLKGVN